MRVFSRVGPPTLLPSYFWVGGLRDGYSRPEHVSSTGGGLRDGTRSAVVSVLGMTTSSTPSSGRVLG